jgi:hypothetical protein
MLGQLFLVRDQPSHAIEAHHQALTLARQAHSPRDEADAIEGTGRCAMHLGNHREAADQLQQARAIYERIGALHAARAAAELMKRYG